MEQEKLDNKSEGKRADLRNANSRALSDPYCRFISLKSEWERDTKYLSSITEISMHPAYQQIIGMGAIVLPYIIEDMGRQPNHWFWALKSITGEDPVKNEYRGNIKKNTESWVSWAKDQGFV